VGTPRVLQVKNKGQALLLVIFRADVFLLKEAIGASAFAGIVDPANQILVIVLLADASEICGKSAALHLLALADGVACEAPSCFEKLLSMCRIARRMLRQGILQARLPKIGGDGFDLLVFEAKVRHFRGRTKVGWLF